MPDYEKLRKNLEARGFDVTYFDTAAEAVDYLDRKLDGKTVGHGGSITSCHAGSCAGVFEYLALKVLQSDTGKTLPYDVIRKLLYLTVDVVVHIHNDRAIGRHITEIWFDPSVKRF